MEGLLREFVAAFRAVGFLLLGVGIAGIGVLIIWVGPAVDRYVPDVGPWDEQGLRRGLVVLAALVFLGGLRRMVPRRVEDFLPAGPFWTIVVSAVVALTLLQYSALGGGQPLWSVEHVVLHLAELVGVQQGDLRDLTAALHHGLAGAARPPWVGDVANHRFLVSNGALLVLAYAVVRWTGSVTRLLFEPAWTVV